MLRLPQWFKDFALCFSLANLCYFRSWSAIRQIHNGFQEYFSRNRTDCEFEELTVLNVILLGALSSMLEIPSATWEEVLCERVPKKHLETNLNAFREGRTWMKGVLQ